MSLNWSLGKIPNNDTLCWVGGPEVPDAEKTMNPITESLIWLTMGIDIGRFTEKNIDEVIFRLRVYSKLFGKPMTRVVKGPDGGDDLEYFDHSIGDIRAHIGLSTNVSDASRAAFLKNCMKRLEQDVENSIRWEKEKAGE